MNDTQGFALATQLQSRQTASAVFCCRIGVCVETSTHILKLFTPREFIIEYCYSYTYMKLSFILYTCAGTYTRWLKEETDMVVKYFADYVTGKYSRGLPCKKCYTILRFMTACEMVFV